MRVTPLRTAYRHILALRTAYRHFVGLAYCVPFINKNNHFGRFHLHKEDKMTVCRISGVSWHTSIRTCVRLTTEIRKIEKLKCKMQ